MRDGYKEGYDKGYSDGKSGKPRNPKPPLIKSVIAGSNFATTYVSGYNDGYRKGAEAKQ